MLDNNERVWLMQGDCLERMQQIPSGSVDMVLTDPPYGTTACKWDSVIPLDKMWEQLKRIIKSNGVIAMTSSQPFSSALVMSNPKMFKHEWIWIKNRGSNFANTVREPMKEHEIVLVFSNGKWVYNKQMQERTGGGKALVGKSVGTGKAQRDGILQHLNAIDIKSIRAIREGNQARITELEIEAAGLREELKSLIIP